MLAPHIAVDAESACALAARRSVHRELVEIGSRKWGAMAVHVQELDGCERLLSPLKPATSTLLVMLEAVGGNADVRPHPDRAPPSAYRGKDHISFIPAGMEVWESVRNVRYLRQVAISFSNQCSIGFDCRLMFADKRVWRLASLLANEVLSEKPLDATYGESLGAAISTGLTAVTDHDRLRSGLTPRQLKRVTEFVWENASARIHLSDMAALVNLSESHFSRAFKTSTGVPPHRWLLNFRVAESQRLLLDTSMSLAEIALALGFSDQGHFTRAFSVATGKPPAAWRKSLGRLGDLPRVGASAISFSDFRLMSLAR